jgi:hypothetical protein
MAQCLFLDLRRRPLTAADLLALWPLMARRRRPTCQPEVASIFGIALMIWCSEL